MNKNEIILLLTAKGKEKENLRNAANNIRKQIFSNNILIRGVIELTNICRVNCLYCPMRKDNTKTNSSFVLSEEAILETVNMIKLNGINVVFFQSGETNGTTKLLQRVIPKIKLL